MWLISSAIIKLSLIALLGFYLYKKNIIDAKILDFLSFFVVNFAVPFLIFTRLIEHVRVDFKPSLAVFIFLSIAIFLIGFLLSFFFSLTKSREYKREFISMVSFQNCGYLPMVLALFLFPPKIREEFLIYTFLYILGFDVIMWSIGSFIIFKKRGERYSLSSLFTPPIISITVALLLIYTGLAKFIPAIVSTPLKMVGDTSFALSMIILGCWLARISLEGFYKKLPTTLQASFLKLIVTPFIFFIIVMKLEIFSLLGLFIVLEASMPSAVSLPIVVSLRKADSEFVSQGVLLTHLLSIITVPFWLGLYLKVSHFSF